MSFRVDCEQCNYDEQTSSYSRAQDLYDDHHITTGHRPSIDEQTDGTERFTVYCGSCEYREKTSSYDRAKDMRENHHIPTGYP